MSYGSISDMKDLFQNGIIMLAVRFVLAVSILFLKLQTAGYNLMREESSFLCTVLSYQMANLQP